MSYGHHKATTYMTVTTALAAYMGHAQDWALKHSDEREADLPKYLYRGAIDSWQLLSKDVVTGKVVAHGPVDSSTLIDIQVSLVKQNGSQNKKNQKQDRKAWKWDGALVTGGNTEGEKRRRQNVGSQNMVYTCVK